jgi:phosphatidylglycerol---prolipoprotein diacylglyceryl transferase
MFPELFRIGPIPVYSYGLMLGLAFLVGSSLLTKELRRNRMNEDIGIMLTFFALLGGILGSKVFYIFEEWNFDPDRAFSDYLTSEYLFSPAGLTFYGGLIFAIIFVLIYCKVKKLSVYKIFDMMAPAAALGYGIARIGCHLSGDGDYGISVNNTFWEFLGYSYVNGTVPTAPGELVHPAPIYELVASVGIFLFLWNKRTKLHTNGLLFSYFLILMGIERLLIEFIRLNPHLIFGLTQAQLISIGLIIYGVILFIIKSKDEKDLIKKEA